MINLDLSPEKPSGGKEKISIQKSGVNDMAVIGLSVRAPLADNAREFWENIRDGKDCIIPFPEQRKLDTDPFLCDSSGITNPKYNQGGFLSSVDQFDHQFFKISPKEAALMSPVQRLFLEAVHESLEDAGYGQDRLFGTDTGVYLGYNADAIFDYKDFIKEYEPESFANAVPGNLSSLIGGRISYMFDFHGPSVMVDTACSSSLVAVHLACQGIRNGDCSAAIVGSIKLLMVPLENEQKLGIESSDYRARAFDNSSDGTGMGEGVGVIVIKPLSRALLDHDHIYAVIKGSAINQDGNSIGITAPNVAAQEKVIAKAWENARVDPATISYIEAHGTGTKLGDPIEIAALTKAFRRYTNKKQFCAIASLKTNIGHLDNASGIMGMIKAILSLENKTIAPSLHYNTPNKDINFEESPVFVNVKSIPWESSGFPRRCGVSAFGLSGTNSHIVLEEAPVGKADICEESTNPRIFTLSAKTKNSLDRLIQEYRMRFSVGLFTECISDICYTANVCRTHHDVRLVMTFENDDDFREKIKNIFSDDFEAMEKNGILFGDIGAQKADSLSITDYAKKIASLNQKAEEAVKTFCESGFSSTDCLQEIARLYVNGAKIRWDGLYQADKRKTVSLPAYSFEPTRCWVKKIPGINGLRKKIEIPDEKIQKQMLPVTLKGRTMGEYTDTEKVVGQVWSDVLGFHEIGVHDDFYELGGDSIFAVKIVNHIKSSLGINLDIGDLIKYSTIEKLAAYAENRSVKNAEKSAHKIANAEIAEYYPVSSAQKRFYVIQALEGINTTYNVTAALRVFGNVDPQAIESAVRTIVSRHEILRTSFHMIDGEIVQKINVTPMVSLYRSVVEEQKLDEKIREFIKPFDLSFPVLLKVALFQYGTEAHVLVFDFHHAIVDGVSIDLLIREFMGILQGKTPEVPVLQYKDFSVWQNSLSESDGFKKQQEYWRKTFSGILPILNLPLDYARGNVRTFRGNKIGFSIPSGIVSRLSGMASANNMTMNVLFSSVYALLLGKYCAQDEVVLGSITAGRNHQDLENMIGVFINFLPLRLKIDAEQTLSEYAKTCGKSIMGMYENQDYPFDNFLENMELKTDRSRNPVFDTLLNFHSGMDVAGNFEAAGLSFCKYELKAENSNLDLQLDMFKGKTGEYEATLEYNSALFDKKTIDEMAGFFNELLSVFAENPEQKISAIKLFTEEHEKTLQAKRKNNRSSMDRDTCTVVVSSTFTSEPVGDYMAFWCRKFGIHAQVQFSPYNQVIQELLDSQSLLSKNDGINFVLVRFEDFIRDDASLDDSLAEKLQRNFSDYIEILRNFEPKVPCFVAVFPVYDSSNISQKIAGLIHDLNRKYLEIVASLDGFYAVDLTELSSLYNIEVVYDALKDREGHLPFTEAYFAALGTTLGRKIVAYKRQHFKAIVLDCDNTLWQGVCGEDGPLGIVIGEEHKKLQEFLVEKNNSGILLLLCSKNNENDVWEVFEKNTSMVLKKEHISGSRINWNAKSQNMIELSKELNICADSFIFLDDSPLECAEVLQNMPEVLTLNLPEDPAQIMPFISHCWAFDRVITTREDGERSQMYRVEKQRQSLKKEQSSLDEYIRGLALELSIEKTSSTQISRIAQLTQRTNQFNLSTKRRKEGEIAELIQQPNFNCWTVSVRDRFGDYGISGAIMAEKKADLLILDSFLLSCRILGRGLEDAVLAFLGEFCVKNGLGFIEADYVKSDKNKPALDFLEKQIIEKRKTDGNVEKYFLPAAKIPCFPGYISKYVMVEAKMKEKPNITEPKKNIAGFHKGWDVLADNEDNLLHSDYLWPLRIHTGELLLQLPINDVENDSFIRADYRAAENTTQENLIRLWEEILKAGRIGQNDNFFRLGGHSLKAANLVSGIHKEFGVNLSLKDIFDCPTVRELSALIDVCAKNEYSPITRVPKKEFYPVSSTQKRLFILNQLDDSGTGYNIPVAIGIEGKIDVKKLEKSFSLLIARHESLRTSFHASGTEIIQKIHQDVPFHLEYFKKTEFSLDEEIRSFISSFDLGQAPLIRAKLIEKTNEDFVLLIDMHHCISDGSSAMIVMNELALLYGGEALPELPVQYKDYAHWLSEWTTKDSYSQERLYWIENMKGVLPVLKLPTDFPRPNTQSFEGARIFFHIPESLADKIRSIARDTRSTLYMVLLAAYNILLMKYSDSEEILVGTPVAGRTHEDVKNVVGMFVNTLVMRNFPVGTQSFIQFLSTVKNQALNAFRNGSFLFEDLLDSIQYKKRPDRNAIYDASFNLLNMEANWLILAENRFNVLSFESNVSKVDLTLTAHEKKGSIFFEFEYASKLFKQETIIKFSQGYMNIIEQIAREESILINDITLVQGVTTIENVGFEKVEFSF